ncbi:glycosyl transferase [Metallosphaera yellowstonensis MK1]|uniref:Glycosyl transferase n=1 Tax=Metallosphaera yellowstonensis MK1 TaxID=671065 RepID=H2C338_9CREN|nr:glycosyl transferase [Metallosphaera yellowstonensis MK1]
MDFLGAILILSSLITSSWLILQALYSPHDERVERCEDKKITYSIIIAVKDEDPEVIGSLVENLKGLEYPEFEVIIVSDDSPERFREIEKLEVPKNFRIVRREAPTGRKAGALNYGVSLAKGEVLVFLDSEARVERDFLKILSRTPWEDAVALRLKVRESKGRLQRLYSQMTDYSMEHLFLGRAVRGFPIFPNGSAFAIRREVLASLGGWNEGKVAEDLDMGIRLFLHGYQVRYIHDIVVETLAPFTWRDLFQQIRRWAYGSGELLGSSLKMLTKGGRGLEGFVYANQWGIYPLFLLTALVVGALDIWFRPSLLAVATSFGIYAISALIFSLSSRTVESDLRLPVMILAASLIGYLSGLLRINFKWSVTPKRPKGNEETPLILKVISWTYYIIGIFSIRDDVIMGLVLVVVSLLMLSIP